MNTPEDRAKKSFIDCFTEFMSEPDDLTEEELVAALEEEGIDVGQLGQRVRTIVERESAKRRLAWRERARKKRSTFEGLLKLKEKLASGSNLIDKATEILRKNYGPRALAHAQSFFRNKNDVSENDLETLVEDLEDLDLLENLDRNEDL